MNLTAVEYPDGAFELHQADCESVQAARELGYPLMTLFGCERLPEDDAFLLAACLSSPGRPLPGGLRETAS